MGGFLLCFVGVIPATVFVSLIIPVLVYENVGAIESFKRSITLVKNDFWLILIQIFVLQLILSFLSGFIQLFSIGFSAIIPQISGSTPNSAMIILFVAISILFLIAIIIVSFFSSAFSISFYVILYFNQRVKVEDFGVERLTEDSTREQIEEDE